MSLKWIDWLSFEFLGVLQILPVSVNITRYLRTKDKTRNVGETRHALVNRLYFSANHILHRIQLVFPPREKMFYI